MRVKFLGGVQTVTGSATLLESGTIRWLVDCGMFQGGKELEERNWMVQPYHPQDLSFILLTHAHIDHSGLIPKLVKEGFSAKVICTKATLDLCEIMLKDNAHIQEMEAEWRSRKNKRSGLNESAPLYTMRDVEKSLRFFHPIDYDEVYNLNDGVRVRFRDAGHILGSAIIELWVKENGEEKKLVFSGDLGNTDQPLLKDPSLIDEGDFLWLESTYGNRLHKSHEETVQELSTIIKEAIHEQAKVIIPAFAVERTQNIIFTIGQLIKKGTIPSIPVYIDSPLAISATEIFKRNPECFDQETKALLWEGEDPLDFPEIIYTQTTEASKSINNDTRSGVIVSASGMCEAGRILHHLKHHLWRESSHIVFIGYQAEGTIGRRIVDGAKMVKLFGEEIAVKAHIHTLGGFSAHADQRGLLDWLSHFKNPKLEVFINHGEEKISKELAERIVERFSFKTILPRWKEKRSLFGYEREEMEKVLQEEEREEGEAPWKTFQILSHQLDRNYKRLRRKLRHLKSKGRVVHEPRALRKLEEINQRLEELDSEIE